MGPHKVTSGVRVNVKLAPGRDRHKSLEILSEAPGVRSVTQTFPDEVDDELSGLYLLEIDSASLDSALDQLRQSAYVEYAEVAPLRKLIR